jgi:transposase
MRPPSVYANLSCPAGCPCEVTGPLYGPHRVGVRLVMILLSHRGWTAVAIAELLGCDPSMVRRRIHRYNQHGVAGLVDRPRRRRPRLGSPKLGDRIRRLLTQPKAWTIARLYQRLGRPALSLRTLRRRVSEVASWRRPPAGGQRRSRPRCVLAELHQQLAELPAGDGGAGRGRDPRQPAALGALTIQGRVRQVHAFLRARTPQQMLTTAAPHSSP